MPSIPASKEARIVSLLRRGMLTRREIARQFRISPETVSAVAERNGIPGAHRRWTADEDAILRRDYYEMGPRALAPVLGRGYQSVSKRAKRLGLTTRVGAYGKKRRDEAMADGES